MERERKRGREGKRGEQVREGERSEIESER